MKDVAKDDSIIVYDSFMDKDMIEFCKIVIREILKSGSSSKKVARELKDELDYVYQHYGVRFDIIITSNESLVLGKKLFGRWMSCSSGNKHFLIIASYPSVESPKITEEQMDRIEDWASGYFIEYDDNNDKYKYISLKLKKQLDSYYGNGGNRWAVIIVRNVYVIRAKALESTEYAIQFPHNNECSLFIFRGGSEISRNHWKNKDINEGINKIKSIIHQK